MKTKLLPKRRRKPRADKFTEKLVKIGNSQVVCLPEALIKRAGLKNRVAISFRNKEIIIRPAPDENPRAGWEEQIKREIAKHGPPEPMDPGWEYIRNQFDEKEWTW